MSLYASLIDFNPHHALDFGFGEIVFFVYYTAILLSLLLLL